MSQDYFQAMPVFRIPEDSTAAVIRHTLVSNGAAVTGLDGATGSKLFYARTRAGVAVAAGEAASWYTDGSDGVIQITVPSAVVSNGPRDLVCEWEVQALGGVSGVNLVSDPFILRITPRAKVS